MAMQVSLDQKSGKLTIVLDANIKSPPESKTGKTRIIASSNGNQATEVKVNGKILKVGVNAFISREGD